LKDEKMYTSFKVRKDFGYLSPTAVYLLPPGGALSDGTSIRVLSQV
jgi:hypothetical protein